VQEEVERAREEAAREDGSARVAAEVLTTAQARAADVLAARLEAFVSSDSTALGFPVTSEWWSVLRERVLRHVLQARQAPPSEKIRLLRQADAELVEAVAEQFRLMVAQRHAAASGQAPGNVAMRAALEPVLEHLARVAPAVQKGDLGEAHKAYGDAVTSWEAAKNMPGVHMGPNDQAATPTEVPQAGLAPPTSAVVPATLQETPVRRSRDAFLALQRQNEAALAIVAGMVAVIAGVVALYVGKATWGSVGDAITGVLWGLGITAAADGVAGFAGAYQTLTK
jgi:hypothetical protein